MLLFSLLFIVSAVSGILSAAATPTSSFVTAFVSGFHTRRSKSILEALLDNPAEESSSVESITMYKRSAKDGTTNGGGAADKSSIQVAAIHDSSTALSIPTGADMSMIFINSADTLDENRLLQRLQDCLRSLLISQSRRFHDKDVPPVRRPFIIVFTGSTMAAQQVEYLLKEAWLLLDTEDIKQDSQLFSALDMSNLFRMFDIQIILTPHELHQGRGSMLNPAAVKAVSRAINNVLSTSNTTTLASVVNAVGMSANNALTSHNETSTSTHIKYNTTTQNISKDEWQGMELATAAMRVSLTKALLTANNSAAGLGTLNTADPTAFASIVSELVANATQNLREYVSTHTRPSTVIALSNISTSSSISTSRNDTVSPRALQWAESELSNQLYVRLQPLYKRQVQQLKAIAANEFNRRVSPSELPITIHILEDLQDLQKEILRNLTDRAAQLVPAGAPATIYNAEYEVFDLTQTMSEFVLQREHQYRAMGVLPRGGNIGLTIEIAGVKMTLPPTEIGFHLLASHPLGRDHRQDVLGARKTDSFDIAKSEQLYSEQAWKGKAWVFVKNTLKNTALKVVGSDFSKKEALRTENRAKSEGAWALRQRLKEKVGALEEQLRSEQQRGGGQGIIERLNVRRLGTTLSLRHQLYRARKDAEFAREMAMLPLSLKNPDLGGQDPETPPEAAARRKDKKLREKDLSAHELGYAYSVHTDQPATDWTRSVSQNILINRLKKGPERFIRWDVEPLHEAKRQLDELVVQQSKTVPRADRAKARAFSVGLRRNLDDYLQQVTDKIPLYGRSRYRHPEHNYGPEYDPQPHPEIYPELANDPEG